MTNQELIEQLQKLDPNAIVVLQGDPEGNSYSPCAGVEAARYVPDSAWRGECLHCDEEDDLDEADLATALAAVVLWPKG